MPTQSPFMQTRFRNIFAPPEDSAGRVKRFLTNVVPPPTFKQEMQPPPEQDEGSRYFDEIQRIRGNRGPALTAYQDALRTQPTREANKPSKGRRVAGILGGIAAGFHSPAAGVETARSIVDAPYNRSVEDYNNKMRGLGESASLEREETESQLKALSEARALGLKYDEFKLKRHEAEQDFSLKKGTLGVAQSRAEAYIKNLNRPDFDFTPQEDGSILATNKHNPAETRVIPASTVAAASLDVARTNADTNRMNADTNRRGQEDTAGYRAKSLEIDADRAATYRNRPIGQPSTPTEQGKAISVALSVMFRDPRYADYIKQGTADDPETYYPAEDDGTEGYAAFMREYKKRVAISLKSGMPFGDGSDDEEMDDDGSIVITPR